MQNKDDFEIEDEYIRLIFRQQGSKSEVTYSCYTFTTMQITDRIGVLIVPELQLWTKGIEWSHPSTMSSYSDKVHIFWEGHKILQNLHLTFDCMYYSQKLGEDF